jgi:hypothetical protein
LRALSDVLSRDRKPPARLSLAEIEEAVRTSPLLKDLSAGTAALIYRGLRNLQLITAEDEPTQVYLQLLKGNTDADWKDFIDAHFDYLLDDEVSLLDLTSAELRERLSERHSGVGKSTLAATARLIRGMMTRSFEQEPASPVEPVSEGARASRRPPAARAAAKPREQAAAVRTETARREPTGAESPTAKPVTAKPAAEPAAEPAVKPQEQPARTSRPAGNAAARPRTARRPATAAPDSTPGAAPSAAPAVIPLSGSITLPLGGSNSATLSWSLSTFDARSVQVVRSQLDIAAQFIDALTE